MANRRRWRRLASCLTTACLVSGCSLTRLAAGQLELINDQRALDEAVARERDPERRALLAEVPAIRRFAEEVVGMQPGRSYAGYFATEREGMTYVLSASQRTQLRAYTWWFPIAGSVEYRSYASREEAEQEALALESRGHDTWIAPSRAYSTLGFFRDPVSTTMLRDGLLGLVEVLFHEMAHAHLYVPGQTEWNEALATLVGEQAALRYLDRPRFADTDRAERMRRRIADRAERHQLYRDAAARLHALYARRSARAQILDARARIFAELRRIVTERFPDIPAESVPSNNAHLLHALRYGAGGDAVDTLWRRSAGNFRVFWRLAEAHARTLE